MAADFQDRLLDELMPAKLKIKEEPAIVEDVAPAAGFNAAACLPAVQTQTTALVKATAVKDDAPDWRGTCAICLDKLPVLGSRQTFYLAAARRFARTAPGSAAHTTSGARSAARRSPSRRVSGCAGCRSTWTTATPRRRLCSVTSTSLVARASRRVESGHSIFTSALRRKGTRSVSRNLGCATNSAEASRSTSRPPRCCTGAQPTKDFLFANSNSALRRLLRQERGTIARRSRQLDEALRLYERAAAEGCAASAAAIDKLQAHLARNVG